MAVQVMDIKRLNAQIASYRSELNKYEEQLEDFKKYRDFLDSITPTEWFDLQQLKREERRQSRTNQWKAECEAVWKTKADAVAEKAKAESDYANARTQQEAEQAEKAIKMATLKLKVGTALFGKSCQSKVLHLEVFNAIGKTAEGIHLTLLRTLFRFFMSGAHACSPVWWIIPSLTLNLDEDAPMDVDAVVNICCNLLT